MGTLSLQVNYNHEHCHQYPLELTSSSCESDVPAAYFVGKSPFPFLDKFVESTASVGNISGDTSKVSCIDSDNVCIG